MIRWVVLRREGEPWWQCQADALPYLVEPGQSFVCCMARDYRPPAAWDCDVILNPHTAPELWPVFRAAPERIMLYETENMLAPNGWRARSEQTRRACGGCTWLNYSHVNARVFSDWWHPLQQRHELVRERPLPTPALGRPIDVLFVGSMNSRRMNLVARLLRAGVWVHGIHTQRPAFGAALQWYQAHSRLFLNVHYYEPGVFESFRVVPAVHQGVRVLSERAEGDEGAEWCETAPYDRLFDRIQEILGEKT